MVRKRKQTSNSRHELEKCVLTKMEMNHRHMQGNRFNARGTFERNEVPDPDDDGPGFVGLEAIESTVVRGRRLIFDGRDIIYIYIRCMFISSWPPLYVCE